MTIHIDFLKIIDLLSRVLICVPLAVHESICGGLCDIWQADLGAVMIPQILDLAATLSSGVLCADFAYQLPGLII